QPGPFAAPATGPAYVKVGGPSRPFFFEGTGNVVGSAYYVSFLAPDLTTVRFARYSANYIPQNAPVLAAVDDINHTVGFWRPQPDYRIPERLSPGFADFPDAELEAMYEDQGATFIPYQARIGRRAIRENPDADLVMIYIEEPDGSGHQFTLTDPRQASNPLDPSSLGANQDPGKVARFERYLQRAYQLADRAVASVIDTVGVDGRGLPRSNIFVVSDHGMAPFHTAVNLKTLLTDVGIDTASDVLSVRTSGPAANIYVNLAGRESGGTVDAATYQTLVAQIAGVLRNAKDPNWAFNYTLPAGRLFSQVSVRPLFCSEGVGFCTSDEIGQDSGDVFAVMAEGYNFDGIQRPRRRPPGDPPYDSATSVFSVPNFYGAHGYDPTLPSTSASFIAAGPAIRRYVTVDQVSNIDVAPTIMHLLGVQPSRTVDGQVLPEILEVSQPRPVPPDQRTAGRNGAGMQAGDPPP
ncbi:MAG: alkaline phosphatase family protein, partial [Sandaracinaceae bacterium]